ncbi:Flp family type IVb pilin [Nocardioides cheoyonin]|uniref:Flp family type IVb pilin n=1 Tax=Nocardioides cheoyonin TaxID=3156615 RepID=UPI0032B5395B
MQSKIDYLRALILTRLKDERGASAVEYGLLVAAIAVAIITIVFTLGDNIAGMFDDVNTGITSH